jgi:hypothetical protein
VAGHDCHEEDGETKAFAESFLGAVAGRAEGVQDGDQPPHAKGQHCYENDARNGGIKQPRDQDCRASLGLQEDEDDRSQRESRNCEEQC